MLRSLTHILSLQDALSVFGVCFFLYNVRSAESKIWYLKIKEQLALIETYSRKRFGRPMIRHCAISYQSADSILPMQMSHSCSVGLFDSRHHELRKPDEASDTYCMHAEKAAIADAMLRHTFGGIQALSGFDRSVTDSKVST